jgi:hypothetical protein
MLVEPIAVSALARPAIDHASGVTPKARSWAANRAARARLWSGALCACCYQLTFQV